MNLRTLINKAYYGTIGYIGSVEDLEKLQSYIAYNKDVLKEFKQIIVATNYIDDSIDLRSINKNIWNEHFPDAIMLDSPKNRGHNHGTADLDNMLVDYCKQNQIEWLCKSANDVVIQDIILDKQVDEADFYYLNGIGYGGMVKYDFDFDKIMNDDFYPQTNFYFINVSKIDYLNDSTYLDETYQTISNIPNYNGKIWEHIEGWSCEDFLKQCVVRNNLKKQHIIPEGKYRDLLSVVKNQNIHDCSHKNIMIEGICHYHIPQYSVIVI